MRLRSLKAQPLLDCPDTRPSAAGHARVRQGHLAPWLALIFCAVALQVGAAPLAQHVFIISIDGGKPAAIARSDMPTLKQLAAEGACTWGAQTIFPSITLPSHTSMLTGVCPQKHKILWNDYRPAAGVVQVPTVFSEAKRAGLSTAMFVGKEKFRHLLQPGTVDCFSYDAAHSGEVIKPGAGRLWATKSRTVRARLVAQQAAQYITEHKPNLCFIHFTDPDDFGHKYGWGSPEQLQAFADVDRALAEVLQAITNAGLAQQSVLLITADHGGHNKTHGTRAPVDMTIPWIAWGKAVKPAFAISSPVSTCDTAATALWLLDVPRPQGMEGHPVLSAFEPAPAPAWAASATAVDHGR